MIKGKVVVGYINGFGEVKKGEKKDLELIVTGKQLLYLLTYFNSFKYFLK